MIGLVFAVGLRRSVRRLANRRPPYDLLDEILELHVEQCRSAEEIIAKGYDEQTVRLVLRLVRMAEFKRKQAAPVLKVTSRAFGTGWRMPIVRQE
jgi:NAD+ synthase (glutamine-hydrolysing)